MAQVDDAIGSRTARGSGRDRSQIRSRGVPGRRHRRLWRGLGRAWAVIQVTLTKTDIASYEIAATAGVSATFTEDYKSSCSHYTDDASGSGTVSGQGGLQAGESGETYEFYVDLPGATGSNRTVRDDSPCGGPNYADTPEWPVPPVHVTATDTISDPHHITGTLSIPREGGTESVTWDFVLP